MNSILERLRGKVSIPITDGLGPVDGQVDFFERQFPTSRCAMDAAEIIEDLLWALKGLESVAKFGGLPIQGELDDARKAIAKAEGK